MYDLHPSHVFVHERVYRNPLAVRRMERMLAALGNPETISVTSADSGRIMELCGPPPELSKSVRRVVHGYEKRQTDPAFIFNTFVWDEAERDPLPDTFDCWRSERYARLMAGVGEEFAWSRRDPGWGVPDGSIVCQGGWGIHSLAGCVHRCAYCPEAYIVNFQLDLEEFAEHLLAMLRRRPQQKLFRYDLFSDSICFEPEYGASKIIAETFAKTDDQYLLYYTKSNNVDHLLELPSSNAIFYLTLSTESVCRDIELGTPSMAERIEALRKCQEAGYRVRVGLSPIIPVPGWREEATAMLEQLFAVVKPETLRLWVISLFEAKELDDVMGDQLDPACRASMLEAAPSLVGKCSACGPFPLETRAEIYRHYIREARRLSPETPVSLCTEERRLWELLADELKMSPDHLYCCCGGVSA